MASPTFLRGLHREEDIDPVKHVWAIGKVLKDWAQHCFRPGKQNQLWETTRAKLSAEIAFRSSFLGVVPQVTALS
jgi:hypothetical protein